MPEGASRPPIQQLVHDLRSPLAIVDGFAALLARDTGELTAAQRADYAQRIRAAATQMRELLDDAGSPGVVERRPQPPAGGA